MPHVSAASHDCMARAELSCRDSRFPVSTFWVAVKELSLSYENKESPLFTIYTHTHYGNLI